MTNLTTQTLAQFTSPVIRSLKWAANASLTRINSLETATSDKAKAAAIAWPTRPLGTPKDGSNAHKALSAFVAMLTERGVAVPPAGTIAPSTIIGAFGVTDLTPASLSEVANVCKTALDVRRQQANEAKETAKPSNVTNVLDTKAPEKPAKTPAAAKPAAKPALTQLDCACPGCGTAGSFTKERPFCGCGQRVYKLRPGRKAVAKAVAKAVEKPAAAMIAAITS